jgi:hypothetical protein
MRKDATPTPEVRRSDHAAIDAFVRQARAMAKPAGEGTGEGGGRLILALDATMSRQPTWDLACRLQGEMFDAVGQVGGKGGGLSVQLVYFRGFGECRASRFVRDTGALKDLMTRIDCRGGHTQIGKVLSHALKETGRQKVNALVYIGDAMEEKVDELAQKACRSSRFRKATTRSPRPRSARSRGCPRAHGSGSTAVRPGRCRSCFPPSPSSLPGA